MSYTPADVRLWLQTMAGGTLSLLIDNPGLARAAVGMIADFTVPPVGQISEHFTWKEFLWSDTAAADDSISNVPAGPFVLENLKTLAAVMEKVRAICDDNPVTISSGYRSPETNAAVGGADNSAHLHGLACDFVIPGYGDVTDIVQAIQPAMIELGIDQLIHEGTWVHLGLAIPPAKPRYSCFAV